MPRIAQNCTRCRKPSPAGSHIWKGLCGPCRQVASTSAPMVIVDETMRVVDEAPPVRSAAAGRRQPMLPIVAEQELVRLGAELRKVDLERLRLEKLLHAVCEGWLRLGDLRRIMGKAEAS